MQVNFQSEQNRMLYVTLKIHVLGAGEMIHGGKVFAAQGAESECPLVVKKKSRHGGRHF